MSDVERLELYEKLERSEGRIVALEKQVMLYCLFQSSFYKIRCDLRTLPTNTEGFLRSRSWQGLLESKQTIGGNHAFFLEIIKQR